MASKQKKKKKENNNKILPIVTQYQLSVPKLKHVLIQKLHSIGYQLWEKSSKSKDKFSLIGKKKGIALNDLLVRGKM